MLGFGLAAVALAVVARPARYEIDGLSMAPGLLPGDVVATGWLPPADRLRTVRRWDRWIVATADGTPAIKRVVGLPGETVSLDAGDLAIAGRIVLTPPRVLAELATAVAGGFHGREEAADGRWHRTWRVPVVLDDAAFAPAERRTLLPVRDVGMAAVLRLPEPASDGAVRVRLAVADRVVGWRLPTARRVALVAGRLDGHLVAAAWPLDMADRWPADARPALPPRPPAAWDVARAWPTDDDADVAGPVTLSLSIDVAGHPADGPRACPMVERLSSWRDVLHRPAADGIVEWAVPPGACFLLGDFPSGSRDSRHWGPVPRDRFLHRIVSTTAAADRRPLRPAAAASDPPRGAP